MFDEDLSFSDFFSYFPVSRETYEKLTTYVDLLRHWQGSVNLISPASVPHIWKRHILDCYQATSRIPEGALVTDIGSGAGLPGIILAIAGYNVSLVESDGKKVAFLREANRLLGLNCTIYHARAESVNIDMNQIVTARAFASIVTLLHSLKSSLTPNHNLVLFKGKTYDSEYREALTEYVMDYRTVASITEPESALVFLSNIQLRGIPA